MEVPLGIEFQVFRILAVNRGPEFIWAQKIRVGGGAASERLTESIVTPMLKNPRNEFISAGPKRFLEKITKSI